MRSDLLLRLADLLEADAANEKGVKFDLGEWGFTSTPEDLVSCGTTACAMGLAAFSGAFKDEGLTSITRGYDPDYQSLLFDYKGHQTPMGLSVAEELFEIPFEHAAWLFLPSGYGDQVEHHSDQQGAKGELMVATRIRAYVDGTASPPDQGPAEEVEETTDDAHLIRV